MILQDSAGTAPSGANKQPWRFVVVTEPAVKKEIRLAAEKEEKENYEHRMPNEKPFLLIPAGYPAKHLTVPDISRKPINDILEWR